MTMEQFMYPFKACMKFLMTDNIVIGGHHMSLFGIWLFASVIGGLAWLFNQITE